jgi:glutamate/tyrosine decarboxylase-like PLP-dependent enzyme
MAYGKQGHQEIVERNCELAQYFGRLIQNSNDFELLSPVRMNVVCFTLAGSKSAMDEIRAFLNAVRDDGRVFFTPTVFKGVPAIRAAISNWLTTTEDMEVAFEVIREIAEKTSNIYAH